MLLGGPLFNTLFVVILVVVLLSISMVIYKKSRSIDNVAITIIILGSLLLGTGAQFCNVWETKNKDNILEVIKVFELDTRTGEFISASDSEVWRYSKVETVEDLEKGSLPYIENVKYGSNGLYYYKCIKHTAKE